MARSAAVFVALTLLCSACRLGFVSNAADPTGDTGVEGGVRPDATMDAARDSAADSRADVMTPMDATPDVIEDAAGDWEDPPATARP